MLRFVHIFFMYTNSPPDPSESLTDYGLGQVGASERLVDVSHVSEGAEAPLLQTQKVILSIFNPHPLIAMVIIKTLKKEPEFRGTAR